MDDTLEVTTETGKHTLNTDKIRLGLSELFDTGAGTAPTNDFSVVAAGDPIVVKVFRRGYNTNLHQN